MRKARLLRANLRGDQRHGDPNDARYGSDLHHHALLPLEHVGMDPFDILFECRLPCFLLTPGVYDNLAWGYAARRRLS